MVIENAATDNGNIIMIENCANVSSHRSKMFRCNARFNTRVWFSVYMWTVRFLNTYLKYRLCSRGFKTFIISAGSIIRDLLVASMVRPPVHNCSNHFHPSQRYYLIRVQSVLINLLIESIHCYDWCSIVHPGKQFKSIMHNECIWLSIQCIERKGASAYVCAKKKSIAELE